MSKADLAALKRDELILEHVPFVKYQAYRLVTQLPPSVEIDDLINAGVLGLIDAVSKFDPARGVKFKTYAELRIRGAMIDSLRELDWAPQALRRKSKEINEARDKLQHELGREADDQEVQQAMGIGLPELQKLRDRIHRSNIGTFRGHDGSANDENNIEYYPDSDSKSPHLLFQKQELRAILAGAIDRLTPRARLVVSLYYFEELTMKEIGAILDVKESRVSQIHSKTMLQLRQDLEESSYQAANQGSISPDSTMANSKSLHVLTVEDDPDLRQSISEFLRTDGHVVAVASDSQEALELLNSNAFDLVITAINSPGYRRPCRDQGSSRGLSRDRSHRHRRERHH